MGATSGIAQPAAQSATQTQQAAAPSFAPIQGNVFQQASAGLNQAMQGTQQGMNYQPMNVQAPMAYGQGYNASIAGAQGYNAANARSQGYNAANVAGVSPITAQNVNAGQIAGTNLGAYTNPYESQVVQNSLSDIDRARQMQANELAAQAQKAGAFGGSRAALMQSELGRNALQQAAQTSAQLRQAGFQNAQQLAGQDIASRMQADLANQGANLQAQNMTGQFGMQAQLANQAAQNAAGQFGASAFNTAALQNAAAQNQARQFGAGAFNTAGLQNAAAMNQAGQFGASAMNTANLANQNALMQAQQLNQSAGLQGAQQRLGAASQMGNLANLGFGIGQQTQAMQQQSGTIAQAINQALIDAAKAQFGGYTGAPAQSLGYMASALGATPSSSTTTNARQPGLFDYLTLGATALGGK